MEALTLTGITMFCNPHYLMTLPSLRSLRFIPPQGGRSSQATTRLTCFGASRS